MLSSSKKVICTICARGGSKGVKNKNIKHLLNKPLIAHTIEQALASKVFSNIVVSTDSDDIADVAQQYRAEVFFKRSPSLASDSAGKLDVIKDAFIRSEEHYNTHFDYLVDLDVTSPLRKVDDINNALQQCIQNNNDNLITAMPSRRSPYFNMVKMNQAGKVDLVNKLNSTVLCRQDAPKTYDMNASIYIWKRNVILECAELFLEKTGLYIMPEERSIDIDSDLDFEFVSFLMKTKVE